ncbi:DUF4142 domain-containing protein [Sphingomonas tabacisoli]|uniref:DUF4142 domain-containing protein n=1 Tax=Sphingomonas tabacisoli TaxID=2249466 RepID=A0ABW4I658_9SPHN
MKRFAALSTAAALGLVLAACSKHDETNTAAADNNATTVNEVGSVDNASGPGNSMNTPAASAAPMTAQAFADTASASDAYEIAASKLAETKAKDASVKNFAADMVKDHTKSTENLKAAAAKSDKKVTPAGTMTAEQQANVTKLQGLSGADFDKEYATQQVDAHTKTLAALEGYRDGGDSTHLKAFARETVPVVQHHLEMAQKLAK